MPLWGYPYCAVDTPWVYIAAIPLIPPGCIHAMTRTPHMAPSSLPQTTYAVAATDEAGYDAVTA
jgi:hypothetical protein